MSLMRIPRHRTWRMLPFWLLAAGVNTSALLGVAYWRAAAQNSSISALTLILVSWVGVATYLAFTDVRTRCTHFEMSLPAKSRRLWLNNLATTLAGGLLIVGLTLGLATLRIAPSVMGAPPDTGVLAVALCSGLVLATLLLQARRPTLAQIPLTAGQVVWTVVVLVGTPVALAAAAQARWLGLVPLLAAVGGMALWSYRAVPPAYSLAPRELQSAKETRTPTPVATGRPSKLLMPWMIARGVSSGAKELLAVPFILLFAVVLGGGLLALEGGSVRELRFLYLPITTYLLFALTGPRLSSLHHVDALPISRRPLVAALVTPYLLLLCLGYGIGAMIASDAMSRLEYVNFEESEDGWRVTTPLRVYSLAWDGKPPPVESPWGETAAPEPLKPFAWSRVAAYSPYSAPPGSSARLIARQISLAVEAVYGASISPEEIRRRYLVTRGDGGVTPRGEGLTLRRDDPNLKPRSGPMFPVLLALTAVPWLLLTALLLRAYRAGVRERVRQTIVWGSLALLLGSVIATTIAEVLGVTEPWAIRALVEIPVMRLGQTATGVWMVWIVVGLLIAGAYLIVQRQFLRMEIPTKPSRYTLIDMARQ